MAEPLVGKLVADKYRIVRRLGGGGMGTVYVAVQEPLGREVALKVIRKDLSSDDKTLERFRREAQMLSTVHHPHIVTLHDFGTLENGSYYFAMELVKGDTLRQRLQRRGPLPIKMGVNIMRAACGALAAAHGLGIIHRDLKPENILIMDVPGVVDFIKLVDFGVAKLTDSDSLPDNGEQLTAQGSVVGTPGYIAPEVAVRGITTDPRSDLYALGVVWFECLSGKRPFHATTPTALMMAHALDPVPPLPDDVPLPIAGLVQRLLAKSPDDRPESAEELAILIDTLPPFDGTPRSSPSLPHVDSAAPTVDEHNQLPRSLSESDEIPFIVTDPDSKVLKAVNANTELTEKKAEQKLAELQHVEQPRAVRGGVVIAVAIAIIISLAAGALAAGVFLKPPQTIVDAGLVVVTPVEDAGAPAIDAGTETPTNVVDAGVKKKKKKKDPKDGDTLPNGHNPDIYSD
jgi:serine/threonine protein kinase